MSKSQKHKQALIGNGLASVVKAYAANGKPLGNGGLLVATNVPEYTKVTARIFKKYQNVKKADDSTSYEVLIDGDGYSVATSLLDYILSSGGACLPGDYKLVGYYTGKSQYRKMALCAARVSSKGNLVLAGKLAVDKKARPVVTVRKLKPKRKKANSPSVVATTQQLAEACRKAVSKAEGFHYHELATVKVPDNEKHMDWRNYFFNVSIGGTTHVMRADCVFAMAKRDWTDGVDAYGTKTIGAVVHGRKKKQWKLLYEPSQSTVNYKLDLSNIDHVIPQTRGGRTKLANLQLMRIRDNSMKSDSSISPNDNKFSNAWSSIRTMMVFAKGLVSKYGLFDERTWNYAMPMIGSDIMYSVSSVFR